MNLDKRSFENLVYTYSEELNRILEGEPLRDFLTPWSRRLLRKKGLLVLIVKGGRKLVVSPRALEILEEVAP